MHITAAMVKELRDMTGAGMMDCKKALVETGGSIKEAIKYLREKGMAKASKRADKVTQEGIISSYIHAGYKIGVLLELKCETDFVARNEDFVSMANRIAKKAEEAAQPFSNALSPKCFSRDSIAPEITAVS